MEHGSLDPQEVAGHLVPLDALREAAECLKCLAHPVRLRIIDLLRRGNFSVEEVAAICGLSQPATSGHLRLMKSKGLLESRRVGRSVFYSIRDGQAEKIFNCIEARYGRREKEESEVEG